MLLDSRLYQDVIEEPFYYKFSRLHYRVSESKVFRHSIGRFSQHNKYIFRIPYY